MNSTEKAALQDESLAISDDKDGGATVAIPEGHDLATAFDESTDERLAKDRLTGFSVENDGLDNDPDREAIRERRREERKHRKEAVKGKLTAQEATIQQQARELAATKAKLEQFEARFSSVEQRAASQDVARLEQSLQDADVEVRYAKMKIAEATSAADGAAAAEATERLLAANEKLRQLATVRDSLVNGQAAPKGPAPAAMAKASVWMGRHGWYNKNGADVDSEIVRAIDKGLIASGFNPSTDEFWNELDSRLQQHLPHRYNGNNDEDDAEVVTKPRRSVVVGSGREAQSNVRATEARIPAAAIQAWKEAGIWDDPKRKAKVVSEFLTRQARG